MSYYLIRGKHSLPRFVVMAVASWVIALAVITVVLLVVELISAKSHQSFDQIIPGLPRVVLNILGAYAGLSSFCLYLTMWIYWLAVDRGAVVPRIGWFLVLLFVPLFGAMIYSIVVWKRDVRKMKGPQPVLAPDANPV